MNKGILLVLAVVIVVTAILVFSCLKKSSPRISIN